MDYKDLKEPLIHPNVLPLNRQLRLKRLYENMTVRELAEWLGFSATLLSYYETGTRKISRKHIERVKQYVYDEICMNNAEERKENAE